MTEREAQRIKYQARKARDPEASRQRVRKQKLRMRYRHGLPEEIERTAEKLAMLQAIQQELS